MPKLYVYFVYSGDVKFFVPSFESSLYFGLPAITLIFALAVGFEPTTFGLTDRRSTGLSYARIYFVPIGGIEPQPQHRYERRASP